MFSSPCALTIYDICVCLFKDSSQERDAFSIDHLPHSWQESNYGLPALCCFGMELIDFFFCNERSHAEETIVLSGAVNLFMDVV